MIRIRITEACLLLFCCLLMPSAYGQQARNIGKGILATASLDTIYSRTDNYFFQDQNPVSADGYILRPYLALNRGSDNINIKLRGAAEYSDYRVPVSTETSYLDGSVFGDLDWFAGTRNRLSLSGIYQHDHDPLGTGRTTGNPNAANEADQWDQGTLRGEYRFGAKEAAINVQLNGGTKIKEYSNNREATRSLDFQTDSAAAVLFFNYSPKTALLANVDYSTTRFDFTRAGSPSRDYDETRLRLGVQWKATAKTTGDVRAGYSIRDYSAVAREVNKFNWTGSVTWSPGSRSTFTFLTGRSLQESYLDQALVIDNKDYAVEWAQRWTARFVTYASSRFTQSEFVGSQTSVRDDDISNLGLTFDYNLLRYVSLIGGVNYSDRDSKVPPSGAPTGSNSYENTIVNVGLRFIL